MFYGWSDNRTCQDCGGTLKPKEEDMSEPFELPTFLDVIKASPWQAVKEILSCAAILALMIAALYFKEILGWVEKVMG
jgi:hypothetical protein